MEYKCFPNSVFVTWRHWLVSISQCSPSADIILLLAVKIDVPDEMPVVFLIFIKYIVLLGLL
jgi:hypothetical protein